MFLFRFFGFLVSLVFRLCFTVLMGFVLVDYASIRYNDACEYVSAVVADTKFDSVLAKAEGFGTQAKAYFVSQRDVRAKSKSGHRI